MLMMCVSVLWFVFDRVDGCSCICVGLSLGCFEFVRFIICFSNDWMLLESGLVVVGFFYVFYFIGGRSFLW